MTICDDRREPWDDRRVAWVKRSAAHWHQGLKSLAVAPTQIHFGAILQANTPIAAHPGCYFCHPGDIDQMGFVNPHEPLGVEFGFQLGERGADLERPTLDVEDGVVA